MVGNNVYLAGTVSCIAQVVEFVFCRLYYCAQRAVIESAFLFFGGFCSNRREWIHAAHQKVRTRVVLYCMDHSRLFCCPDADKGFEDIFLKKGGMYHGIQK